VATTEDADAAEGTTVVITTAEETAVAETVTAETADQTATAEETEGNLSSTAYTFSFIFSYYIPKKIILLSDIYFLLT
jgi:hypothetical protein